ncbi:uncharacterized protein LOC113112325 isoform X2 [Carassius auratus]|uniref:Uncharacterized protein LOC113112325 isoform X2 n=1 Tax=Carassius auratus TaxID=7957 RepID=A0A6P6QJ46_CARAU|nr:uncharacterized protein LOC113112325 isoform X2 [Carassius auratus]
MSVTKSKRPRYNSEIRRDKVRNKTRICIGDAFERWRRLKTEKNLNTDANVANFLLDSYYGPSTSTPSKRNLKKHHLTAPSLSSIVCASSETLSNREDLSPIEERLEDDERTMDASEVLEESLQNMSIQDAETQVMNEQEINDLMNSVIDWGDSEGVSNEEIEADDSEDEDYVPRICIRLGGALQAPPCIDNLPVIDASETVHDIPDVEPPSVTLPTLQQPGFPDTLEVMTEDDLIGKRASITYEDCLRQLATLLVLPVQKCPYTCDVSKMECQCRPPFEVSITRRGTASIMEWTCLVGHTVWRWSSQPTLRYGMLAGDFMLASNILLSGSNYAKVSLLFQFMNMGMVDRSSFFTIQDTYGVDTVKEFWEERRAEAINRLKDRDVVIVADGRMDSPGHCAQYCTYTAMENESREIISVITVDKRETGRNSVIMEREAFVRTVDTLLNEVKLVEVCTDAHVQISALMNKGKYKDLGLQHSLDMWHGAKNLAKRIHAASQVKGQSSLSSWLKDIVNHFWWCCKTADSYQEFLELWLGLLHHVTNEHRWVLGSCQHADLESGGTQQWLERGSMAHEALKSIVRNKRWLNEVHKYLNFRSTADLESFQNHILMYASKRTAFSPPVFEARMLLAAMDYNYHKDRPELCKSDGSKQYRRLYKKNARRYMLYTRKTSKMYGYIPELQAMILQKRLAGKGMPRRRTLRPDDPRRYGPLPPVPAPTIEELLHTQVRRGLVSTFQTKDL